MFFSQKMIVYFKRCILLKSIWQKTAVKSSDTK